MHSVTDTSSHTQRLAQLACGYTWSDAPEDVRHRLLLAVRDTLACGIAGSATSLSLMHRRTAGSLPNGRSTVLGYCDATSPQVAAFQNATAMNAMDFDDTASVSGHPGAPILAAALAVAEQQGASGVELLQAVLAGYEVAARVAIACRPSPEQYALVHGSQCFLGFGAAAAAARVLTLNEEATARAFGIVAALTPIPVAGKFGWEEGRISWIKDNVNWPSEAGVRAAYLAKEGFPASTTVFDGDRGFWRMIASDRFEADQLVDATTFHLRDLAFKPYPCCRWLHASLEAVKAALDQAGGRNVEKITIWTTRGVAASFGAKRPATMIDAQFSAPHAVAALCLGIAVNEWWREDLLVDPAFQKMMDRVTLKEDATMTLQFLETGRNVNRIPARALVEFADGQSFEAFCPFPQGTPSSDRAKSRSDDAMLAEKHRQLLKVRFSEDSVEKFWHTVEQLANAPDLTLLSEVLRQVRGPTPRGDLDANE